VHSPELARGFCGELSQLGRTTRRFIPGQGAVAEHVAHSLAEPIPQIGNDFVNGLARTTGVAAILNQHHFCAFFT
jgi:hypothetical protein